jgi:hypothetical protein
MERYDSTKRAARHLLGAGMIAVAMLAMNPAEASAQVDECLNAEATVCGHVYMNTGGTTDYEIGEGIDTVQVALVVTDSTGTHTVDTFQTNPQTPYSCVDVNAPSCGYFDFVPRTPGDYQVCVVAADGSYTDCRSVPEGTVGQTENFGVGQPKKWGPGTGTPGYWKNHPEAWQSYSGGITIGGEFYTQAEALALMSKPVAKDKVINMFASLVSAKLNVMLNNNPPCINPTVDAADVWMSVYGQKSHQSVAASSAAWVGTGGGDGLHQTLDEYNNGVICSPHRN